MKKIFFLISILTSIIGFGQKNQLSEYEKASILLKLNKVDSAYFKFKELEKSLSKSDTLYNYSLWYYTMATSQLESENRMQEKFDKSLKFGLEALEAIQKGKEYFDAQFAKREYFMVKNIIVSYYGLGNFEEGNKWKLKMYDAKSKNLLPEGIDEYFNYDFFTFENKNIWGYEWFKELPKDRYGSSFSKVVYYVYSQNEDGTDKDQLYRLHVLMFHGSGQNFDYVLTKRLEVAKEETSGTLYDYTYKEKIDFQKLHKDIIEVLKGNLQPDTKTTISKNEETGKVNVNVELNSKKK